MLAGALGEYRPAIAVCQMLRGVAGADRAVAESVLRNQGFGDGLNDRSLGSLLMLMQTGGLVSYSKKTGRLVVNLDGDDRHQPLGPSVFVSPGTPYSNKAGLRRVLADQTGFIDWFDKHFMPVAFEALADAVDGNVVKRVRILSLELTDHAGRDVQRQFRDLRKEFNTRGVALEWHVIDSKAVKDAHDRWIIGDAAAWNVPNVNAIYSGQHSELHRTSEHKKLEVLFESYWTGSRTLF